MRKNAIQTSRASTDSLCALLIDVVDEEDKGQLADLAGSEDAFASLDSCDVLCQAMERLLKGRMKPAPFKVRLPLRQSEGIERV